MARGSSLLARLGLAVASPRAAVEVADDPKEAGRAGTDLFVALIATVVVVHLRDLVAAGWLGVAIEAKLGFRAGFDVIADAVTTPLALLLIAALAIWIAAGRERSIGRDFDLACVTVLPYLFVDVGATLIVRLAGWTMLGTVRVVVLAIAAAWMLLLVVLAIRQARRARPPTPYSDRPEPDSGPARDAPVVAPGGKRAGLAVVGAAVALLAAHGVWIATHLDWLRPMEVGDPAPPFLLATVDENGDLGQPVRSEELLGHVVVLDFWATWCKPCLDAMPAISNLAARGEVLVLSVVGDDPAKARALFRAKGYRSILVTDDGTTAERFGVDAIPHLVVIDREGVVRYVSRGDGNLRNVIDIATDLARN